MKKVLLTLSWFQDLTAKSVDLITIACEILGQTGNDIVSKLVAVSGSTLIGVDNTSHSEESRSTNKNSVF